jgi:hypothetical protein
MPQLMGNEPILGLNKAQTWRKKNTVTSIISNTG